MHNIVTSQQLSPLKPFGCIASWRYTPGAAPYMIVAHSPWNGSGAVYVIDVQNDTVIKRINVENIPCPILVDLTGGSSSAV